MSSHRAHARLLLALLGASLVALALSCGTPQRRNQVQVIRRGGDVLAAGGTLQITDSVPGDAMLTGGQLGFSGATGGDYLGAGGSQVITGRIHGNARVAGGQIRIAAPVDRNATIAGGSIEVDRAAVIGRNAYVAGGTVRVDGAVHQGLQVSGGTVILDGQVGSDVAVSAGELRVGPRASIAGDLRYRVPARRVHIDSAARITGRKIALPVRDWRGTLLFFRTVWLLGFLLAGAAVVALAPGFATEAAERLRELPGLSAIVGLLWLIVVPIVAIFVAMTLIGLPLALLTCAVYVILAYIGRAVLALWLGRVVLGARARTDREGAVVSFLAGGIILVVVMLIPVLGQLVLLAATVLGVGALLVAIRAWVGRPAVS